MSSRQEHKARTKTPEPPSRHAQARSVVSRRRQSSEMRVARPRTYLFKTASLRHHEYIARACHSEGAWLCSQNASEGSYGRSGAPPRTHITARNRTTDPGLLCTAPAGRRGSLCQGDGHAEPRVCSIPGRRFCLEQRWRRPAPPRDKYSAGGGVSARELRAVGGGAGTYPGQPCTSETATD